MATYAGSRCSVQSAWLRADNYRGSPKFGASGNGGIATTGTTTTRVSYNYKRGVCRRKGVRIGVARAAAVEDATPFVMRGGHKAYVDELDLVDLLDPDANLVPFNAPSYNAAAFLWKKIDDISQERRSNLLKYLQSKHIYHFWETTAIRFKATDPLFEIETEIPPNSKSLPLTPEFWNGRITGVPKVFGRMSRFKMSFFHGVDGYSYGRLSPGFISESLGHAFFPLYFIVRKAEEVLATEEPCDLAFEFGDGQLQILEVPDNFPKPAKHIWPFNDQLVMYMRVAAPSVLVGEVWMEGKELHKMPRCLGKLLLIKDHTTTT